MEFVQSGKELKVISLLLRKKLVFEDSTDCMENILCNTETLKCRARMM
jgi:hypothetical protein